MTDAGHAVDSAASYSLGWEPFATNVCAQAHQSVTPDKAPKGEEYADESSESSESDEEDDGVVSAIDDDADDSS